MIVFPGMLAKAAEDAGMKVPADPDNESSWKKEDFPHFSVFCNVQLCRPVVNHGEHFGNAKLIASLSIDEIKLIRLEDLIERGLSYASSGRFDNYLR